MKRNLLFGLVCAFLLVSCGAPGRALTPTREQIPTQDYPPPSELPPASPYPESEEIPPEKLPANAILTYQRSGGIAGKTEKWTIYADGRIISEAGADCLIAPDQVTDLVNQIVELGFFDLNARYVPLDTCCDRFTYELTLVLGNSSHTVTALQAYTEVPQALWDILEAVNLFIETNAAGNGEA